jgi:iron(III) transport system ATP-binding protein
LLNGHVVDEEHVETELTRLAGKVPPGCRPGCLVKVLFRPDDIVHDDDSPLTARIVARVFRGASYLYTLELPSGTRLFSLVHSHHNHAIGEQLGIRLELDHVVVFPLEKTVSQPVG